MTTSPTAWPSPSDCSSPLCQMEIRCHSPRLLSHHCGQNISKSKEEKEEKEEEELEMGSECGKERESMPPVVIQHLETEHACLCTSQAFIFSTNPWHSRRVSVGIGIVQLLNACSSKHQSSHEQLDTCLMFRGQMNRFKSIVMPVSANIWSPKHCGRFHPLSQSVSVHTYGDWPRITFVANGTNHSC